MFHRKFILRGILEETKGLVRPFSLILTHFDDDNSQNDRRSAKNANFLGQTQFLTRAPREELNNHEEKERVPLGTSRGF